MEAPKPQRSSLRPHRATLLNPNTGTETGQSDTSHTEKHGTVTDEWDKGAASHEASQGTNQETLLGPDLAKKYNDATGFLSEGSVETKVMDESKEDLEMEQSIRPSSEQKHSIESIMSRPVKINNLTFSTNQVPGTIIGVVDVLAQIRDNTRFRLLREKLSSFYGSHFRAHLKITLNSQPMESGIFQIFFVPYYSTYNAVVDPNAAGITNKELLLPFATGCPNVFCNISKQSEVELVVPYTGPVSFINLTNNRSDFGTFFIQSVVPITDNTNNANCEMSVYMYFSNVELFGTTPNNVIASTQGLTCPQPPSNEADMKTNGPLTQIGNTLMPVLDSLGLSSPNANPNCQRMVINPYSSPATTDTTKSPLKVSYTSKHHLNIGHLGVNDQVDEMDITSMCYKPTYYNQFTWSNTSAENTKLYSYSVEPNCTLSPANNQQAPTRLRYVSNAFRYWRGSMRFLFMVAANQYHSGRLRFVYTLGGPTPTPYVDNYPRTFTQVVDIRKGANFVVECPYFASTPWRVVPQEWDDTNKRYYRPVSQLDDAPCMLEVFVENVLRTSSVTSTSVKIICLVGGGEDFELGTPIAPTSYGVVDYTPPTTNARASKVAIDAMSKTIEVPNISPESQKILEKNMKELLGDRQLASTQGLDFEPISMVSGADAHGSRRTQPHRFTIGEKVSSVRALIKRYQLLGSGSYTLTTANPFRDYVLYPFEFRKPTSVSTISHEMLTHFRLLYRFTRGSIRYLITTNDSNLQYTARYDPEASARDQPTLGTFGVFGSKVPIREATAWPGGSSLASVPLTATIPYMTNLSGGMEIEFPYYSRYHKLDTTLSVDDSGYPTAIRQGDYPAGICYFQIYNLQKSTDPQYIHVYRAAADDFTYGYLLGSPFTVSNVNPTL